MAITDMEQWATSEILANLAKYGVKIDERIFVKMASKYHSPAAVAKAWKLNKLADAAEILQMAVILWERLCPNEVRTTDFQGLMQRGYAVMEERNEHHRRFFDEKRRNLDTFTAADDMVAKERYDARTAAIVTDWLKAWESLMNIAKAEAFRAADQLDSLLPANEDGVELPSNWLQDLEMELDNLSWAERPDKPTRSDKVFTEPLHWAAQRLQFVREVLEVLPGTDGGIIFNFRRDEAEAQFLLGNQEHGDALYAKLIADEPVNAWGYIGWGDLYSPRFCALAAGPDVNRAREIYEQGLRVVEEDREDLEERLILLEQSDN